MPQDSQLQQAVLAGFAWEPSVTAAHIGITSRKGTVTGHSESFARKRATRRVKDAMPSQIRAMAERIEVRLPSDMRRGSEEAAAAAVNRLSWDVSVPHGSVKVEVETGCVALSGQVDLDHRREAVREDIRTSAGIRGVFNEIKVSARVNAAGWDNEINHALHRSWFLSPNDVRVTAEGGTVCLAGAIQSPHDRDAPGVAAVLNDIAVV